MHMLLVTVRYYQSRASIHPQRRTTNCGRLGRERTAPRLWGESHCVGSMYAPGRWMGRDSPPSMQAAGRALIERLAAAPWEPRWVNPHKDGWVTGEPSIAELNRSRGSGEPKPTRQRPQLRALLDDSSLSHVFPSSSFFARRERDLERPGYIRPQR